MLIKSVELKNIKSYRDETIEFGEGINGICGQNGHGKTTILEAIGYVLFNYMPYKEADFLRRGEKSGNASVEVLANGVSYTLIRKLGSAAEYSIRGGGVHITGKKDVLAWLASNLFSVSGEDELPRIFANAVGVPQGMFTAAFMETPAPRKKIFDEILRVDEYRNAYENLRTTMILIDEGVRSMETEIEKLRIRTENYGEKKKEKDTLNGDIENLKKDLKECSEHLNTAKNKRDELKKQKDTIDKLENEIKQGRIRISGLTQLLKKSKDELKRSEDSAKLVSGLSGDKERYDDEKKKLDVLDGMRKEREALKDRLNRLRNELSLLIEKRLRLESLKTDVDTYAKEKVALSPMVEKQNVLERTIEGKKGERAVAINELKDIKSRMSMTGAENICPVMKGVKCTSVKDFSSYFSRQLKETQSRLEAVEASLKDMNTEFEALGDPRGKVNTIDLLERKAIDESRKIAKEIEKIPEKESAAGEIEKALNKYSSLDTDINEAKKTLAELEPLYQKYMQNLSLASRVIDIKKECERHENMVAEEEIKLKQFEKLHAEARAKFNAGALESAENMYVELGAKLHGFEVGLKEKDGQLRKLMKEIAEIEKYLAKIGELGSKLENEKRFVEYAKFIRETLRDSAQHIVLELIGEISEEANNLYCAIMDDFSQELRWAEDYGIVITESGEEKNFQQLSGGEKMGAALALRLALLKMLSNSDFVFLDEPTANMDEIRRENLSEQIMNIKGFKQIFVISHDDTFNEKYGHVVKIEKINGESRVVHEKL